MIITRTPFRISFVGGGTDFPDFYRVESGAVVSTAIDKYMYVIVNKRFTDAIRVSYYSKTEIVETINEVEHELIKEAMKKTGVTSGVEITTVADIPSTGTGLGSSSALTVGALNALYAYQGKHVSAEVLARQACEIEIDIVGEPIGKQDQYISAYGGMQYIQFNPDGTVFIDPVISLPHIKEKLRNRLLLFYTGVTRKANSILEEQNNNTNSNEHVLLQLKELAGELRDCFSNEESLEKFGGLLHKGWILKKKLANGISNNIIDEYYRKAMEAGALGGKITGAGGGGFLLLFCKEGRLQNVRKALSDLREVHFEFRPQGSKIIFVGD